MVGKWHLCPTDEMNLASTRRNWPSGRGFERWYGFLGAETNQWYPDLVYDNHMVDQPQPPEEGYHLTDDLTDKAIEFIKDAKAIVPEKPFFLYYAPGACHAPHHAPKEWSDKFKGRFDMGYEAMREQTLARQKELGLVPADTELPPINPIGTPGNAHRTGRRAVPAAGLHAAVGVAERRREAPVLAAWRRCTRDSSPTPITTSVGCSTTWRRAASWTTRIVVVVSDNGASGEGGPNGSVNEMKFANGVPDDLAENLAKLDVLGGPATYNHYTNGWAMAFNTPFKMWKRYEFNGGTCDPCIISWPAGLQAARRVPRAVPPRDRHRADAPRPARRRRRPRRSRATPRARSTASACAAASTTATDAIGEEDAVLLDARLACDLARRMEGRHDPSDARRLGPLQRRRVGALQHRRRPGRAAQPRGRATRQGAGARQPLVLGGGRERRLPARRSLAGRDHRRPRGPSSLPRASRYVYRPGARGARVAGGQHHATARSRSARVVDIPAPGAQGVLFSHRLALRRPRALREGQPTALRQQLRRQHRTERRRLRGHPDRRRT